jgi:diaminopimelate epimerase
MRFTKMHGIGNDYVYVNGFIEKVADAAEVARKVSDRHYGIGGDGLILILPSQRADVRMQMFNADGSEGEMCGNGIRCVAKYAFEHGLAKSNPMRVETGRGVLSLDLKVIEGKVEMVTVNMGEPILDLPAIPFNAEKAVKGKREHEYVIEIESGSGQHGPGGPCHIVPVSMGNPHAVTFVNDVSKVALEKIGPEVERHPAFPRRVNAHWVEVISPTELKMRTWERGSGITWACGTGACAVCVAGVLTGRSGREVLIHLPGGDLEIEWRAGDNCVYMTGAATEVFSGEWAG